MRPRRYQCQWILDRGYWKGSRCANNAAHTRISTGRRAVRLCPLHAGLALDAKRLAANPGVTRKPKR